MLAAWLHKLVKLDEDVVDCGAGAGGGGGGTAADVGGRTLRLRKRFHNGDVDSS